LGLRTARARSGSDRGAGRSEVVHDVEVLAPLARPGDEHEVLARRGLQQGPFLRVRFGLLDDSGAVDAQQRLEAAATASAVRTVLRRVQVDGDATLFRVVTYLLDELQRTGTRPSNRQIAGAVGLSHTAVANALVRLRPYFDTVRSMTEPDERR
jgi:hypothetical protein